MKYEKKKTKEKSTNVFYWNNIVAVILPGGVQCDP